MASNHQKIVWQIITDWTKNKKGRLYCCNQGMATPINGNNPIWFGPLKRNFKGFPDLFGFEMKIECGFKKRCPNVLINCTDECQQCEESEKYPIFSTVEVKTKGDTIKPNQILVMTELSTSFGVNCYIAKEHEDRYKLFLFVPDESKRGYRLEEVSD